MSTGVGADAHIDWRGTVASVLEWWHDAGVDTLVDDDARDWLAQPARVAAVPRPDTAPGTAAGDALPIDLPAFLRWRRGDNAPEAGWPGIAVEASGPEDAAVMVLVDCPDREDGRAGLLTAGAAGALFGRMLAAAGLSRDDVHIAAVCTRRPPPGRIASTTETQLNDVARHHVALVAPARLLLLGDAASRAVLGTNVMNSRDGLRPFNHKGGTTGVVASFHPRLLLERPAVKADAWRDLQALVRDLPRGATGNGTE